MCQTFYREHERCTCIYISANFTPCAAYTLAHPEQVPEMPVDPFADPEGSPTEPDPLANRENPFADPGPKANGTGHAARAKLLTRTHGGLDLTNDDIDFVSVDVDDLKAPKGVVCPDGIASTPIPRVEGEEGKCSLCDEPDVLEMVEDFENGKSERVWRESSKREKAGKETGKGKEKGVFHKTTQMGSAAVKSLKGAVRGKVKSSEIGSVEYSSIGPKESPKKDWTQWLKTDPSKSMYFDQWGRAIPPFC